MNKLHIISSVVAATLFVGCMTEAERIAYEKQQKERREALQKQRAELLAKQKKEAAERRQKEEIAKREKYWEDIAEHNYNLLVAGLSYNPEDRNSEIERVAKGTKLNQWIVPRNGINDDEKMKGRAILETFGSRYMPNAYGRYEKCRDAAEEIQQMFNDEFPMVAEIKPGSPRWDAFCKTLKGFSKVRMKYIRAHDELCHYYITHKVGAISADELSKLDKNASKMRGC